MLISNEQLYKYATYFECDGLLVQFILEINKVHIILKT